MLFWGALQGSGFEWGWGAGGLWVEKRLCAGSRRMVGMTVMIGSGMAGRRYFGCVRGYLRLNETMGLAENLFLAVSNLKDNESDSFHLTFLDSIAS